MDWTKLLAATIITLIIFSAIVLFIWLSDITNGLIRLVVLFLGVVLIVYANL